MQSHVRNLVELILVQTCIYSRLNAERVFKNSPIGEANLFHSLPNRVNLLNPNTSICTMSAILCILL